MMLAMIPKVLAGPVGAQDRIDFDPVFRESAARVTVTTNAAGFETQARAELGVVHARRTVFAAGNAVPPPGVEAAEPQHDDLVRQYRDKASGIGPKACVGARPAPGSDVSVMIGAPVAPAKGVGFDIDRLLATPRLPVLTPCL